LKLSGGVFDLDKKQARLKEIEKKEAEEGFWSDQKQAKTILKEKSRLESTLEAGTDLKTQCDDLGVLKEFAEQESTSENLGEFHQGLLAFEKSLRRIELEQMLDGPHDASGAIVNINAGAGGTEAQDWAEMLMRMYLRYCEQRGFKAQLVDEQLGEEAGIKGATFTVSGHCAYGFLKAEVGVHRLVRLSPFDANQRRHTSFASVFVYPDIEEDIEIDIQEKDLRIDTYRAGGAGGQHVNKTDSAVRLTHLPTNIVVQCQNQRSQRQNKDMAMRILKARLYEFEVKKKQKEKQDLEDTKKDIAWGSQIRSYVMHPYRMVKDHRTNFEMGDVDAVLDGTLQPFIEKYLMGSK